MDEQRYFQPITVLDYGMDTMVVGHSLSSFVGVGTFPCSNKFVFNLGTFNAGASSDAKFTHTNHGTAWWQFFSLS